MRRVAALVVVLAIGFVLFSSAGGLTAAHAETVVGNYRLTLELPKSTWKASEAIRATARLELLNAGATQIETFVGGPIAFSMFETDGDRGIPATQPEECAPLTLQPLVPIATDLYFPALADDDPRYADFLREYPSAPGFHAPAGEWELMAWAIFSPTPDCATVEPRLQATVKIRVSE